MEKGKMVGRGWRKWQMLHKPKKIDLALQLKWAPVQSNLDPVSAKELALQELRQYVHFFSIG